MINPANITPESIDLSRFPFVMLDEVDTLPQVPGVYLAVDSNEKVHYVGRSVNIRIRWNSHHRREELRSIEGIKIVYIAMENVDADAMNACESAFIEFFDPPLNVVKTPFRPSAEKKQKQVLVTPTETEREIIKLLADFWGHSEAGIIMTAFRKVLPDLMAEYEQAKQVIQKAKIKKLNEIA